MNTCDTKNCYVASAAPFSKCLHMQLALSFGWWMFRDECSVPFVITLIVSEIFPFNELIKLRTNTKQVKEKNASVEKENCVLLVVVVLVTGVFICFFALFSLRMIYVLCTIKRMFGYHSSTCILLWLFVLIRSSLRGEKRKEISWFVFRYFSLNLCCFCWCDL